MYSSGFSSGSGFSKGTSMGVCFLWRDTRTCKFGDACRFSHDGQTPSGYGSFSGQRGVCRNFRDSGECKFGDLCKYSHDLGKDEGKLGQSGSLMSGNLITTNSGSSILSSINASSTALNSVSSSANNSSSANPNPSSLSIQGVSIPIQFNTGAQLGSQQLSGVSQVQAQQTAVNSSSNNNNQYFADGDPDADDETA
jgi:hypothetical protein